MMIGFHPTGYGAKRRRIANPIEAKAFAPAHASAPWQQVAEKLRAPQEQVGTRRVAAKWNSVKASGAVQPKAYSANGAIR
jgi:hypothetical protein